MNVIGGAEGDRTPDLRIANRTIGKTLSICLFESCSHQEKSMVFPFFPILYHRVYVTSCFFWPRIGHLGFPKKNRQARFRDAKLSSQTIANPLACLPAYEF